jgi:CheY-like chemotaxis protein
MQTILVIENDLANRANLLRILSFKGFIVLDAENGEEGLKLAQSHTPDLILCDILMPGMDGYEVLRSLQQSPQTRYIPFLFLTAKATPQDIAYGLSLGAEGYLVKPFSIVQLIAAIEACLQVPLRSAQQPHNACVLSRPAELSMV